jgi:hypothetical protein
MQMSGEIDGVMVGGEIGADLECDSASMMGELDRHLAAACASPDLSVDRAEAERHVNAMMSYAGHASDRCGEILGGMQGGAWSWGGR